MSKYQRICIENGWFTRGDNDQFDYCISLADALEDCVRSGVAVYRHFFTLCHMTYVFSMGEAKMSDIATILAKEYL